MINSAQARFFEQRTAPTPFDAEGFVRIQNAAYEQKNVRNFDKIFSKNIYLGDMLKDSVGNIVMAPGCLNLKGFLKEATENQLPYNMIISALNYNKECLDSQR